jgi:hypothetical protein
MSSERCGIRESTQGSGAKISRKQKRTNAPVSIDYGVLVRTWTDSKNKAIRATKDLLGHRSKHQLPQASPSVCTDDHRIDSFIFDE